MNDQELARALRTAVNVDHSPEFLARVRAFVSMESKSAWPLRWLVAPVVAAVSVAAALAVMAVWRADQYMAPALPARPTIHLPALITLASPPETIEVRSPPSQRRTTRVEGRLPEPLISPDDARALQILVRAFREGRFSAESLPPRQSADRAVTVSTIEIPRVTIEPLPEIARLEGVRP